MFEQSKAKVREERNSRKNPMTDDEARELLGRLKTVKIAKGRKVLAQSADATDPDDLKGPTGNFRAPMVVHGKTLLVGFNQEELEGLF